MFLAIIKVLSQLEGLPYLSGLVCAYHSTWQFSSQGLSPCFFKQSSSEAQCFIAFELAYQIKANACINSIVKKYNKIF